MLIEPGSRRSVAIYGGDGFDSGMDPDDSGRILEEYANGRAAITTDGGRNWTVINPSLTAPLFWTPLMVDPSDANHFVVGGREIKERRNAWSTGSTWTTLFDLGTATSGAARQASAIDARGTTVYAGFCGYCDVVTQNVPFTRGIATNVGGTWHFAAANGLPVRYITSIRISRWEFDVLPGFDNAKMVIDASCPLLGDIDIFLQIRKPDGTYADVAAGTSGRLDGESLQASAPVPGHYRLLVENWSAAPGMTVNLKVTFFNAANVAAP